MKAISTWEALGFSLVCRIKSSPIIVNLEGESFYFCGKCFRDVD